MIVNPRAEIKRLREELNKAERHIHIASMEEKTLRESWAITDQRLQAVRDVLDEIGQMETPHCSNVVRKITKMAQEALKQ